MQPSDPYRPVIDAVADLLARANGGPVRDTDQAAQSLYALISGRLRATPEGAAALAGLEQAPGSEPARAAAAAALAAAGFADPTLPGQIGQWVSYLHAQWQVTQPPPPAGFAPAQPRRSRTALMVGIVVGVLLLCGGGGLVGAVVLYNRLGESTDDDRSWQEQAADVGGIVDYRETRPDLLSQNHLEGTIDYEITPPPGGPHNPIWQNCQGTVYDEPIADEHAAHSLEHGAVWITYDPALSPDEVERLAERVRGRDYVFMSPYPGLDARISLQAWGYQLKVDHVGDERIDDFIRILRINAGPELGATCGGGVTTTGTTPVE